ncbi:Histone deacetylase phd1 [Sphaceloma murrayae]|uniref:histone deacetylase n=1 Tax=Sphaceloma murrayae TaxID=2082308 RepID=A0A2K1R0I8_9PEZI|nr:Histone deacetylase phd1 [Sphaceloma murrayae]
MSSAKLARRGRKSPIIGQFHIFKSPFESCDLLKVSLTLCPDTSDVAFSNGDDIDPVAEHQPVARRVRNARVPDDPEQAASILARIRLHVLDSEDERFLNIARRGLDARGSDDIEPSLDSESDESSIVLGESGTESSTPAVRFSPDFAMSRPSASNTPARQSVRNGIVQQWEPTTTPRSGNSPRTRSVAALQTPPTTAEDEADAKRRELERLIQEQVDENGIERPKGYNVSFHYNRRVENMHFGRTHPMKPWRLTLTKHLVMGYGLQFAMDNYEALPASQETVAAFHDPEYVEFLSKVSPETFEQLKYIYANRIPPGSSEDIVRLGPFNLSVSPGADCPVFDGMSEYLFLYTGATMEAASCLINNQSDIAINWSGGLHHAHKAEASGFCYINDIVLAILELLKHFSRVLYIDIDVHHGDGVEEAFNSSDRVMTVSLHRHGLVADTNPPHLFFPGTGAHTDNGNPSSPGHHFALNVPIPSGITDDDYVTLFKRIIGRTLESFRPTAIVLQCGADSLGGDRLGQFNLNIKAHGECLSFVKAYGVPLLILGGGGYTARNVARAWCHETALAVGAELNDEIPMHIVPRPQAFQGRQHGDGKLYPDLKGFHANDVSKKGLEEITQWCFEELRYVQASPSTNMERLPPVAEMERVRREVDSEMQRDRETERGEKERKRRERNTGGRGEMRER